MQGRSVRRVFTKALNYFAYGAGALAFAAPLLILAPSALAKPGSPPAPAGDTFVAALQNGAGQAAVDRTLEVRRGDTLMKLLVEAGVARPEAHLAIAALAKVYSPRKLMPGQSIRLIMIGQGEGADVRGQQLAALSLHSSPEQDIRVVRDSDREGFLARAVDRPLTRELTAVAGLIERNLSTAGRDARVPVSIMVELIRVLSFDVDLQREIQPGDDFSLLYENFADETGRLVKSGPLLYAKLTLSGRPVEFYRFTKGNGEAGYFNAAGKSVRRALLRTPIDGARISSGFGMRRDPIRGYSKMHRGTDFAAPRGTPIYAAGSGVIESAGRNGAYGRYVRIRHGGSYKTAYAHMHRIAKGIRKGARVSQGQIIGTVGSSGRTTGSHLHYEVLRAGKQINPLKIKLPSGTPLRSAELEKFRTARSEIDRVRRRLLGDLQVAYAVCEFGLTDGTETQPPDLDC